MMPKQQTLLFPLLQTLDEAGGQLRPAEVYDALARRVGLPDEDRQRLTTNGAEGRPINHWERTVRNVRQAATRQGLIENEPGRRTFNLWALTEKSKRGLKNCRPGVVVTVFTTGLGRCLWAECQTAVSLFDDDSVDLIMTSPPYPLLTRKQYGNLDADSHVSWLFDVFSAWKEKLSPTGSLVINMADTWTRGEPTLSLYQERLVIRLCDEAGYSLCEKLFWQQPSKLPGPAEWVNVRRVRVTPSVEQIWWLAKSPFCRADNRKVLREYSESMRALLGGGGERRGRVRPSGHSLRAGSFSADNGGSIAQSLLVAANTASNDEYQRLCRLAGLPAHPARFPEALPEFFIKFLTEPGDLVADIFGGSTVTGRVAERLGRRWASVEKSLAYARGGMFRFDPQALDCVNQDALELALA